LISEVTKKKQAASKVPTLHLIYFLGFLYNSEDGSNMSLRNVDEFLPDRMTLHQNIAVFIVTAVRTSDQIEIKGVYEQDAAGV
jgi:glutamine amidotransferase-like uncharacterized protein